MKTIIAILIAVVLFTSCSSNGTFGSVSPKDTTHHVVDTSKKVVDTIKH